METDIFLDKESWKKKKKKERNPLKYTHKIIIRKQHFGWATGNQAKTLFHKNIKAAIAWYQKVGFQLG